MDLKDVLTQCQNSVSSWGMLSIRLHSDTLMSQPYKVVTCVMLSASCRHHPDLTCIILKGILNPIQMYSFSKALSHMDFQSYLPV